MAQEHSDEVAGDRGPSFWELVGEDDPNPTTYEFSFLSIGINQNWGLARWKGGGVYFGAGGGLGTALYRISSMKDYRTKKARDPEIDPTLEAVYGNVYLRLTPFKYVDLDVGGRLAVGSTTYDIADPPQAAFVRGAYVDLRIGTGKIKLGPRFEYDSILYSDFVETGWKITPLMLRVVN
jgi:hypothetical protein